MVQSTEEIAVVPPPPKIKSGVKTSAACTQGRTRGIRRTSSQRSGHENDEELTPAQKEQGKRLRKW